MIQRVIEGLSILSTYNSKADVCAEHDAIYVDVDHESVSKKDKEKLESLYWRVDEYDQGFMIYV